MSTKTVAVVGATGFVGRALLPALVAQGHHVRACARSADPARSSGPVEWIRVDVLRPETLTPALAGAQAAYYLVHGMGRRGYAERDRRAASAFVRAAEDAGLERIVYLGGVAPSGPASPHLASRLEVGEVLRSGAVPAIELRASMIIGAGSASWRMVRDLALRLPVMVLPAWLRSRTRPIAVDDVVGALVDALELPLEHSEWFDIPGPETLSGKEILLRLAALGGRRVPTLSVPVLTPNLSALWLLLVTRESFAIGRELVAGLEHDLLPANERYWELSGRRQLTDFDTAARRALEAERAGGGGGWARLEERLVARVGRRLARLAPG